MKSEDERERVEDEWNELKQKEGENIMSFYGKAKAIRMKLESYGDKRPDASMCKHIVRRMLPSLKLCSDHDFPSRSFESYYGRFNQESCPRAGVQREIWRGE